MDRRSVLIGEIILEGEPRISLYADSAIPLSRKGIAVLKYKLAFLLSARFLASDPHRGGNG